jgi:hypothetical protein
VRARLVSGSTTFMPLSRSSLIWRCCTRRRFTALCEALWRICQRRSGSCIPQRVTLESNGHSAGTPRTFNEQLIALEPLGLADDASREAKLVRLDAIAAVRGIATANVRAGYRSSNAVKYVEEHSADSAPLLPWQICSGFAHGRPWAVLGMSEQEQHATPNPAVVSLRLTSDLSRVLYPTLSAFRLMIHVVNLLQQRS